MSTVNELRKRMEREAKAQDKKLVEEMEKKSLEIAIKEMKSPTFKARRLRELNAEKIEFIISTVQDIVGRRVYTELSLGQAGKILGILRTIAFDYKNRKVLLDELGLNESIIDDYLEYVGNPAYYHKDTDTIVEAVSMDINQTITLVKEVAVVLGVQVDTSKVTDTTVAKMYKYYEDKASKDKEFASMVVDEENVEYDD